MTTALGNETTNQRELDHGREGLMMAEPATAGIGSNETAVGSVFVSNYPPFSAWTAQAAASYPAVLAAPPCADTPLGLYMHLPFCRKRCKFCYFRVYTDKNSTEIGRYTTALAAEIAMLAKTPAVAGRDLRFVYFGGGTPSYVSVRHLEQLVADVRAVLPWDSAAEVTFECEPGTLTERKLEAIRGIGVTRLSLGIENFDDEVLAENGRAHVSTEIDRCLPWIRALEFDQLNIDLIAGMVGETWEKWRRTVERTLEVAPDSVTIYQLELPHNTVYSQDVKGGTMESALATWDEKRAWHGYAVEQLAAAGYTSSSAYTMVRKAPGAEAGKSSFVYRNSVWQGCDLLGTGVSSFGHLSGLHIQNAAGWGEYLDAVEAGQLPITRGFVTTADDRLIREWILQLKLGRVAFAPFRRKFGVDPGERFADGIAALERDGYLVRHHDGVEITFDGLLRIDSLLPTFYAQVHHGARYT